MASPAVPSWERPSWPLEAWLQLLSQFLADLPFAKNVAGVQMASIRLESLLQARSFNVKRFPNRLKGGDILVAIRQPRPSSTDARWLGIFGHIDVEVLGSEPWQTDPLKPTLKDGRYYCRGIGDNLGPLLARVLAFSHEDQKSPGIVWVIHAEEEIGSPWAHELYPQLAGLVPEILSVSLWLEETGYFKKDKTQRLLVLHRKKNEALIAQIVQRMKELAAGEGREVDVQERVLNKAFGADRCPCLTHLLDGTVPYFSMGPNDVETRIHLNNESLPENTLLLSHLQFSALLDTLCNTPAS